MTGGGPYRETWKPKGPPCPRCAEATALRRHRIGANAVHRCDGCGGVWVTARNFNEILVDLDRQEEILSDEQLARLGRTGREPIACPTCAAAMNRANFGRKSGVFVDSCRKHGIWFDAGELKRVVEYLRARAQRFEIDTTPRDDDTEAELDARIAAALAESRTHAETPMWKRVLEALLEVLTTP